VEFPAADAGLENRPALAAGNTVVLKPAEYTPLTALAFAEICREVGLPAGVVNIVTGDGATGNAIVEHADIDKIAFTGSTEVGRIIRGKTAGTGKKLSLELGGKSPFIIFDDADLDGAVEGVVDAIWFNQGQVCCAGSRLLVQEGVAETVYAKLRTRMATLRVGDPLDKSIDMGAIVDPVQLKRIKELVAKGEAEGATLFQVNKGLPNRGCFYPPSLFTNVAPASTIAEVEIFGPVLAAHDLPHARRGGGDRQQQPFRPRGLGMVGKRQCHPRHSGQAEGRRGLDQLDQHVRRRRRIRRLSRKRLWP
jgi:aldehyde dehydrogenase (NAD+)